MTIRKVFFWLHLLAGTIAGTVVLIMSVTGVLLMYEKQIMQWADTRGLAVTPLAQRLPLEELLAKVAEQESAPPAAVIVRSDPSSPVAAQFGRDRTLFLDPFTGAVLGEGNKAVHEFFHVMTDWHRWLGAHGDSRATGRAITGVSNLAFLFLVLSGAYLWLPKVWSKKSVRSIAWFRGGLSSKARDFNWHNTIGLWCVVPLFFIVISGVVISYPWAGNLVYRLTGSEPPAQQGPPGGGPPNGERRSGGGRGGERRAIDLTGMQKLFDRASQQAPNWKTISMRVPPSPRAPVSLSIEEGPCCRPDQRSTLILNRQTAEVIRHETYDSYNAGRKARFWLRFIHTGEAFGWIGQTLAGVASLGASFLVYTGIALSWRRFRAWQARRRRVEQTVPMLSQQ